MMKLEHFFEPQGLIEQSNTFYKRCSNRVLRDDISKVRASCGTRRTDDGIWNLDQNKHIGAFEMVCKLKI